jgi:hypothetical protein
MHLFSEGTPQQTPAPMKDPMINLCLHSSRRPTRAKPLHIVIRCAHAALPFDRHVPQHDHTARSRRRAKVSPGVWVKRCRDGIRRQHFVVLRHSPLWAGGMLVPKLAAWLVRSAPLSAVSQAR